MVYLLSFGILVADILIFFIPACALFIVYVLCFRPKWVLAYLKKLYGEA